MAFTDLQKNLCDLIAELDQERNALLDRPKRPVRLLLLGSSGSGYSEKQGLEILIGLASFLETTESIIGRRSSSPENIVGGSMGRQKDVEVFIYERISFGTGPSVELEA